MANYYKIVVNENDETGVDFNAFVDVPAHLKGFIAFGKNEKIHYNFNDEKRLVTGVMIAADYPIIRFDKQIGEHYVIFDAPTIDIIRKKFFKNGFIQNVNKMHDQSQVVSGATLLDSYIASNSDSKLPNIPEVFEHMNLGDGTWIATYYIEDETLWQEVKSGKFRGFSVEGIFEKKQINIKTNKFNMKKQSFWDMAFGASPKKLTFASATTADGVVVSWEGELVEGVAVTVELEGEQVPAPEGDHELTLEDGRIVVITVDGMGAVTTITEVLPEEEMSVEELKAEVAQGVAEFAKATNERFAAIEAKLEAENAALKTELNAIKKGDKFGANPKQTGSVESKLSVNNILNLKK